MRSSIKKPVTNGQGDCVVKMANEKGVGHVLFQKALDDPALFAKFLDELKADEATEYVLISDARIAELTAKAAAVGARIHILRRVRVKQDCEWQEAINLAGPNTPSNYNVRKGEVSAQYPPVSKALVEKDILLLNYSKGDGNWDKATTWCGEAKLKVTNPREVFSIGEQHSTLHNTLGQNPMYVVAPTECSFDGNRRACYVWWSGSERRANLPWIGGFDDADGWFAFCE